VGAPGRLINRRPSNRHSSNFFNLEPVWRAFLRAHAQTMNNFRRNSFCVWKIWVYQHLISHSSCDVLQPLTGWRPGKPPGWSARQTPDLPIIHAFSFTDFLVMMMAIDIAFQVTQTTTTTAYVGSFNQPTSIRFQMKSFPAQTQ